MRTTGRRSPAWPHDGQPDPPDESRHQPAGAEPGDPPGMSRAVARRLVLPLALAQFIASYAATNMNVAISDYRPRPGHDRRGLQTAITLFTLTMAALMIPGSKLTDVWGRKRCFMGGLTVYGVGALIARARALADRHDVRLLDPRGRRVGAHDPADLHPRHRALLRPRHPGPRTSASSAAPAASAPRRVRSSAARHHCLRLARLVRPAGPRGRARSSGWPGGLTDPPRERPSAALRLRRRGALRRRALLRRPRHPAHAGRTAGSRPRRTSRSATPS